MKIVHGFLRASLCLFTVGSMGCTGEIENDVIRPGYEFEPLIVQGYDCGRFNFRTMSRTCTDSLGQEVICMYRWSSGYTCTPSDGGDDGSGEVTARTLDQMNELLACGSAGSLCSDSGNTRYPYSYTFRPATNGWPVMLAPVDPGMTAMVEHYASAGYRFLPGDLIVDKNVTIGEFGSYVDYSVIGEGPTGLEWITVSLNQPGFLDQNTGGGMGMTDLFTYDRHRITSFVAQCASELTFRDARDLGDLEPADLAPYTEFYYLLITIAADQCVVEPGSMDATLDFLEQL